MLVLKRNKRSLVNDIMTTLLLIASANFVALVCFIINVYSLLSPLDHVHDSYGIKKHVLDTPVEGLAIIGQSLLLLGYSNVTLVWAEVVLRTQKFSLRKSPINSRKLRFCLRFYQVLILLSRFATFIVTGNVAITFASAVVILGLLGVILGYAASRRWIVRLIKRISAGLFDSRVMIRRINAVTDTIIVATSISTFAFGLYIYFWLNGAIRSCLPGEVCWYYLLRDVSSITGK